MKKKQYFYSLIVAYLILVVFHITVDLIRFNITWHSIYEAIVAKEASQYMENYTVIAYVVENNNDSVIYIYIKSTLTNRYRRYLRFENDDNALLNGGVLSVVGADNFFALTRGSLYYVTMRDDTFWRQEPLGVYTLRVGMIRPYRFDFWLLSATTGFVVLNGGMVYRLFGRIQKNKVN